MIAEAIASAFQETGISIFLGSALIGAVLIGIGFKKFNLFYIATHTVRTVLQFL